MSRLKVKDNIVPPAVLNEIVDALSNIQFGSIEIQIHNGVVVQLERREKKRWDKASRSSIELVETR
ncbi:MAG: YezD family protein [Cellvibrio sp.]